jgi:sulfatase modifying factor 1
MMSHRPGRRNRAPREPRPGAPCARFSGMPRPGSRSRRAGEVGVLALLGLVSGCDAAVNLSNLEGGCPPKRGATQVKVTSGSSPFCIDTTETTNAEYAQFVASSFTLPSAQVPTGCGGLLAPTPSTWPAPTGEDHFPVINVNWCQAYEYCAWAGKRLCGQIGGGALAPTNRANPQFSQWNNACSGGTRVYPYGQTFDANACGGEVAGATSSLQNVSSRATCVGSVPGLYDMSGSVWEWTDACDAPAAGADPAGVFCDTMGGAFDSMQTADLQCSGERGWTRSAPAGNVGIRCCLDL